MKPLSSFTLKRNIHFLFLDFDGVFTDNNVLVGEDGSEFVSCSRYDGFGLRAISHIGITPIVITSETKPLARQRCAKLKIDCYDSVKDKLSCASHLLDESPFGFEHTAFIGNDINDLPLLEQVAFPVVTPDSHPAVHKSSFCVTNLRGGQGCVRELCDFLLTF